MKEYELRIERLENGFVLRLEKQAPEEAAEESTSWYLYLKNQESLFVCMGIYYMDGPEAAVQYACAEEK